MIGAGWDKKWTGSTAERSPVSKAPPLVSVLRPCISLTDVPFGFGQTLNHASLTLAEAVAIRDLLNTGIDLYVGLYGDHELDTGGPAAAGKDLL